MSFEDNFLNKIDFSRTRRKREEVTHSRIELPPLITKTHDRLKREVFSNPSYSIQAPEFISTYGKENILRDMKEVLGLRKKNEQDDTPQEKNSKILSDVLEGMILVNARENGWLGDSTTMKTSLYDDVKNRTDMFSEWFSPTEGSRVLALGVDVTYSKMKSSKKLLKLRDEIDRDSLGQIRYFKDMRGDFMGTRNNVPRTIIGISADYIQDIAALWMRGDIDALRDHATQRVLVEEIYTQTKAMAAYALRHKRMNAARAYEEALSIVEKLQQQKESISIEHQKPDSMAAELIAQTKAVFE